MADKTTLIRKKILVTGASGFIGARLVEKLTADDEFVVTALVRDITKAHHLKALGVNIVVADLSNRSDIDGALKGQDVVINLVHDFKQSQRNNLRGFANLSEASIKHGVKHFVQVSSIVVYDDWPIGNISEESPFGQPGTEYKNTKVAIENSLQRSSKKGLLHTSILQPTIVYGPFSWLWTDYVVEKLLSGTVVLPGNGEGICNAVYVDDVVDALVLAAKNPGLSGEKYIISGPEPITWREFFESYNNVLGKDSIQYIDVAMLADERSGLLGKVKNIMANPLRLANWKPVRYVLNIVQKLLGDRGIEKLKSLIKNLKKSRGPIVYYPDAGDLELYCATGICRIEKAKKNLGYAPKMDFKSGFELTAEYIDTKLRGNVV